MTAAQAATTSGFENYLVDTWQTEHGLPENSATAMVQSPDGYLWFGTYNGLVRFDGTRCQTFEPRNTRGIQNRTGLPSAAIYNLHIDSTGQLWISTPRGLAVAKDGAWTPVGDQDGWTGDWVRTFSENAGVRCFTTSNGRILLGRARTNILLQVTSPSAVSQHGYFGHVDAQGNAWVAREGVCAMWRNNAWSQPAWAAEAARDFRCAGTGRNGDFILVNSNAVIRIAQGAIRSRVSLDRPLFDTWQLCEDSRSNLWVTSFRNGLYRIDSRGRVRQYTTAQGLPHDALRFVFEDRDKHLWIGTSGGGLLRLRQREVFNWGKDQGVPEPNIKAIAQEPSGHILLGSHGGGLLRIANDRASRVTDPAGLALPLYVQCLLVDRQNRTWLGGYQSGLFLSRNSRWTRVAPEYFKNKSVRALLEDAHGTLWIGHDDMIATWSPDRSESAPQPLPKPGGEVRFLVENPATREIWAGTTEGIFQRATNGWREWLGPRNESWTEVSCLKFQTNGSIWVSSSHVGLARWDPSSTNWAILSETNGIASHDISSILDDGRGSWWLASNRGLTRVPVEELEAAADAALTNRITAMRCVVFDRNEGMASQECAAGYPNTTLRDGSGRLWFATLRGAAVVDPHRIEPRGTPPSPVFSHVTLYDEGGSPRLEPLREGQQLKIGSGTTEITVEWTALDFASAGKTRFRYRLSDDRSDGTWVEVGNQTSLTLQRPRPTRWKLQICAAGNGTGWSEPTQPVILSVRPHVWQRFWFATTLVLIALALTAISVWQTGRARLRASVSQTLSEQKQVEERLIAGQDQIRRVLDALPAAAYACDPLGQLTYFNRHAALLWGRVPRLGHPDDRFCGSLRLFALDGAAIPHDQCWTATALSQQRSTSAEVVIERPGGRRRIVQANANPLIDSSGRLIGAVSVLLDITEDKNARETLAASEILLRQLIQHTPAAVAMFDLEMRYLQASDRWLTDYRLEGVNIIGRNHYELFPNIPGRWKELHRKALAGAVERVEDDLYEHPDGTREYIQWEARPWRKAGGLIGGVVIFTQFVTARRLAEQRIRDQLDELQRWHRATLGREDRVQQLKREVNDLARQLGIAPPYSSQSPEPGARVNGNGNGAALSPTQRA